MSITEFCNTLYLCLALLGLVGEDKLRPYDMLTRTFHN
jgi:hypothetical protein